MENKITTIKISSDLWKTLNEMKECGETFDDVVRRLLRERK